MSTSSKNKTPASDSKIAIGYIASAHGVRGEFCIVPLTDYPERFGRMEFLDLYAGGVRMCTLPVHSVREHEGKGELIVGSDLRSRDEAEQLSGLTIMVDADERVPLPEGTYWVDDLIGLQVFDLQGQRLGEVRDLLSSNGNEIYEIRDSEGELHYIPAVEAFVKEIDMDSGKMVLELIEGLW